MKRAAKKNARLTPEEFVLRAIETLAPEGKRTIHTVYSGMNAAFRAYFPGQDPVAEVRRLVKAGTIDFRFARGGALIGKRGSITVPDGSAGALKKMGLA